MGTFRKTFEILDELISRAAERGVLHCVARDERLDGRTVRIGGRDVLHFGSCSYLGLELDPRLAEAAGEAARRFGTHFSSSRAYLSAGLYDELEGLLERVFEAHVVVAPTTTLAHLAALPVLCTADDALLLDHQGHSSLHMAANQARAQGARVELVRHGRLDELEGRVEEMAPDRRRLWYACDGVYSMYGDLAPIPQLVRMLEHHPSLHLYVDDAHGVSWRGRHGRGYALDAAPPHERMVVATTLAKSFGTGGAVLVFPNAEWRRLVRTCGGPMIFSGPLSPPVLGAAIASARIHLSDEITGLQRRLRERIAWVNDLVVGRSLPLVSESEVPIRFVGASLPRVAQDVAARLLARGFFTNASFFPAVGMKRAGIRIALNLHQRREDVLALVDALGQELPRTLAEEGSSLEEVEGVFGLPARSRRAAARSPRAPALTLQHERSIADVPAELWDHCLGARGSFTASGLAFLERAFANPDRPENDWRFHYYVVRDAAGRPVLATFFTEALWKDDMLSPHAVSERVEKRRLAEPFFLTSRVFSMGSLLTEGDHLFLDRERDWQGALQLLLRHVDAEAAACGAGTVALRDLPEGDAELEELLASRDFVKTPMPDGMVVTASWEDDASFLETLSPKARRHQRREVLPWESAYDVEVLTRGGRRPGADELAHFYSLYRAVKSRNLSLNTFDLPEAFFAHVLERPDWELVLLRLRPEAGGPCGDPPVAVGACFVGPAQYVPMVIGLDYRYVRSHGLYRQCLLQTLRRAHHHGLRRVLLGMGAPLEKRRFGAVPRPQACFVRVEDVYSLALLDEIAAEVTQ